MRPRKTKLSTNRVELLANRDAVDILGVPLFSGTMDQLVETIQTLAASGRTHLIVTTNVDLVLLLEDNVEFGEVFRAADLRTADGVPLVFLAHLLGNRSVRRLTGADLLPAVVDQSAKCGWRVAVVGGTEPARAALQRLPLPAGAILRTFGLPRISEPEDAASRPTIDELRDFAAHVTFICLGAPKQELWFQAWRTELPAGVYIGAGAAIDFMAGTIRRAPRPFQRAGLEWLWRLANEPRRLAYRYLVRGPRFIAIASRSFSTALQRRARISRDTGLSQ